MKGTSMWDMAISILIMFAKEFIKMILASIGAFFTDAYSNIIKAIMGDESHAQLS